MNAPYGRMVMCHMLADTLDELHAMADRIGVARRWFQDHRTPHYDVCASKKALAIQFGAIEIGYGSEDHRAVMQKAKQVKVNETLNQRERNE